MTRRLFDEDGNEVFVNSKRRGNSGCLKRLLVVGAVVFVLLVVGALLGDDSATQNTETESATSEVTKNSAETTESTEPEEQTYGIGETVDAGDLTFTVNGKETATSISTGFSEEIPSTGNYLLVDITVTNNGNESILVDSNSFKLLRGETKYDADGTATLYANEDSSSFLLNSLNPEATVTGVVAFDISEESASDPELQIEMSDNIFYGKKAQVLLNK